MMTQLWTYKNHTPLLFARCSTTAVSTLKITISNNAVKTILLLIEEVEISDEILMVASFFGADKYEYFSAHKTLSSEKVGQLNVVKTGLSQSKISNRKEKWKR